MILCNQWGAHIRNGNWNFLYASLNNIALQTGHEVKLPEYWMWHHMEYPPELDKGEHVDETFHFQQSYWTREYQEDVYRYFKNRPNKNININLGSNCQSDLWFQDSEEFIKNKFQFKETSKMNVFRKYQHILIDDNTIGIGVRLGDFIGHGVFYQIPISWYIDALKTEFPDWQKRNILFLSDDIEHLKKLIKIEPNYYFAKPNGTHTHIDNFKHYHKDASEQLILGSLCNDFIGGSSTFSWWHMKMIEWKGGKSVHCGRNLSEQGEKEFGVNSQYYPTSWIKHEIK